VVVFKIVLLLKMTAKLLPTEFLKIKIDASQTHTNHIARKITVQTPGKNE